MKIPNRKELQQTALNHLSDIDFIKILLYDIILYYVKIKDFIKFYKNSTEVLYSFDKIVMTMIMIQLCHKIIF